MPDVLDEILEAKRARLVEAKACRPLIELETLARTHVKRDFFKAVARPDRVALIAEMKRRSPSAGDIRPGFDPSFVARAYESGGAAALSVLTELDRFGGRLDDLAAARGACSLPVLRKDFVFDPYQVAEAAAYGADAVLLIADMLDSVLLNELADAARRAGVEPLVEVFGEDRVEAALKSGARLIGINTRNLRTLEMIPDNVARLAPRLAGSAAVVAESGIKSVDDVKALHVLPVSAMLVGESLLKQDDLSAAARTLSEAGRK